ncbi:MAG TPA: carboxymuconolactone decarboxylase family protein [Blastocatellia bacterium]|jgi:AhpD family alkylhydroperoxidase|nr:carboxymuconolactone decarboxylase family protein [Blastocatellia bacterium]
MDSKLSPTTESQPDAPAEPNTQRSDGKPQSYSMMEPKMRQIYGQFYKEIYYSERKHIDTKTQELISIAASLVAKCQGCIEGHLKKALAAGATEEEISETISIAAAINAAAIIDLTDIAATNLNINHFPSEGPRFNVKG